MSKTIKIPADALQVLNPNTETALDDVGELMPVVSHVEVVKMLFRDTRLAQALGVFDAYDTRKMLVDAAPGSEVVIDDEAAKVLAEVATKPAVFNTLWLTSPDVVEFLRGIAKA